MKKSGVLAVKEDLGVVLRCCKGVIHVRYKGILLHFTEDAFLSFSTMIEKASSNLMDLELHKLMSEQN